MSGARFLTTSKYNILLLPFTWQFGTTESNVPYNLNSLLQTFLNRLEKKFRPYRLHNLPKYLKHYLTLNSFSIFKRQIATNLRNLQKLWHMPKRHFEGQFMIQNSK